MYNDTNFSQGQVMGTSVGTLVFVRFGWRAAASLSLGWIGWQMFILLLRGPHCQRFTWIGWQGGADMRKSKNTKPNPADEMGSAGSPSDPEKAQPQAEPKDVSGDDEKDHSQRTKN